NPPCPGRLFGPPAGSPCLKSFCFLSLTTKINSEDPAGTGRAIPIGVIVVEDGSSREGPGMLRIARVDVDARHSLPTLKLEGKLVGPWVLELRRACDVLEAPPGCVRLNLSAVTFIDPAGIELLGDLIRRGARLPGARASSKNCSVAVGVERNPMSGG